MEEAGVSLSKPEALPPSWDLRGDTADGLALLTGRTRAYGYRYTEAFLSQVARAGGVDRFTDALACWTTHLWHPMGETGEARHPCAITCYVDGHRKPVYSDVLLPRGLIGRLGVVLGCRALLIACQQVQHCPFSNGDPTVTQCLMQFCQTVMVAVP